MGKVGKASVQNCSSVRSFHGSEAKLHPTSVCAVFEKSQALTNAEVSVILQRMVVNKKNEDPAYQPNPLLVKTQEYVETFSTNKNEAVNEQVRR